MEGTKSLRKVTAESIPKGLESTPPPRVSIRPQRDKLTDLISARLLVRSALTRHRRHPDSPSSFGRHILLDGTLV